MNHRSDKIMAKRAWSWNLNAADTKFTEIGHWLSDVRAHVQRRAPELMGVFDAYAGEAVHGRQYIDGALATLPRGADLLEVGAGALLLSSQLAREGFRVTALEPIGPGFSHFEQLRDLVLELSHMRGHSPTLLPVPAEQLGMVDCVDLAFSLNVMEHVEDVPRVLNTVARSLKVGGKYRFTCPNYLFPYEPHFNIFTFFSKGLTARMRPQKIFGRTDIQDASELWRTLNWITVSEVVDAISNHPDLEIHFNRRYLVSTVERIGSDAQFSARHAGPLNVFLHALLRTRLHRMLVMVPSAMQPLMDCTVFKRAKPRSS